VFDSFVITQNKHGEFNPHLPPTPPPTPIVELHCNSVPSNVSTAGIKCSDGCALWSDLASDGNTRSQSSVDSKFASGKAPASRCCATPLNDPGPTGDSSGWCYCKGTHDSSWEECDAGTA
jgi:hypothetical protein